MLRDFLNYFLPNSAIHSDIDPDLTVLQVIRGVHNVLSFANVIFRSRLQTTFVNAIEDGRDPD